MQAFIDSLNYRFDHEQKVYAGIGASYVVVHEKDCYVNPITLGLNEALGPFSQNNFTHPTPTFLPLTESAAAKILTSTFTNPELIVTKNVLFLIRELLSVMIGTTSLAKTVALINCPKISSRQFINKFMKRLHSRNNLNWDIDWTTHDNLELICDNIYTTFKETYKFRDMLEVYATLVTAELLPLETLEAIITQVLKCPTALLWRHQLSPSLFYHIKDLYHLPQEQPINPPYYEVNKKQDILVNLLTHFYNRTPIDKTIKEANPTYKRELNYHLRVLADENTPVPSDSFESMANRVGSIPSSTSSPQTWEEVDSLSSSFVAETDSHLPPKQEQGCCKIGLELEFWVKGGIPPAYMRKYHIQNEYYSGQFELNNFISDFKTKKDIRTFFRKTKDHVNKVKKDLPHKAYFGTCAHQVDGSSLVFNGCHLHISLQTVEKTRAFCKYLQYYHIIEKFKYDNFPSVRSIMSHHIWGSARDSEYNYKRKRKFRPVAFTPRNTIEIRLWDNEDILILQRADKVAALIIDSIKDFEQGKPQEGWKSDIPNITSTDDVVSLYKTMQTNLTRVPNKHTVNPNTTTITLPSSQEVQFTLDDENSRPHINLTPRNF